MPTTEEAAHKSTKVTPGQASPPKKEKITKGITAKNPPVEIKAKGDLISTSANSSSIRLEIAQTKGPRIAKNNQIINAIITTVP